MLYLALNQVVKPFESILFLIQTIQLVILVFLVIFKLMLIMEHDQILLPYLFLTIPA